MNIKSKGFLSLKNLNKADKKINLGDLKKIRKNIKFTTKKIKVESFPFLKKNNNKSKNKTINKKLKRSTSYVLKNSKSKVKFKIEEKDTDNYKKRRPKRLKTFFNYSTKSNIVIINNDDDEDDKSSNEEEKNKEEDNKQNIILEDNNIVSNRENE